MATRKPLEFDMSAQTPTPRRVLTNIDRQHVGARVPREQYRRLKARAALDGVSVQTLVEQAIDQLLTGAIP